MADIKAYGMFVVIIRDEADSEAGGLVIPKHLRKTPPTGTVVSIGSMVPDKDIKGSKGKKVAYHDGVGFPIQHEGKEYWGLTHDQIICQI